MSHYIDVDTFIHFAAQIQIPIPDKYLGCEYKGLDFCRNNGWLVENMDKGLTVPKMGADSSAENTPNAPKFICPKCLPNPKELEFLWKKSVVRVWCNGSKGVKEISLQNYEINPI